MQPTETFGTNNSLLQNTALDTKFLDPGYLFDQGYTFFDYILSSSTLYFFNHVLAFLSIFFFAIIIYVTIRMFEIRKKERKHLHHEMEEYKHKKAQEAKKEEGKSKFKDERWNIVLEHLLSANPNDWKLAILESDTMLFDLLAQLGFQGGSLGDKLKDANRDSFRHLTSAWDVHTIRNKIAHEGAQFQLSLHEAKRIISMYENMFQDFGFI